jgi:hypothetical protein
LLGSSAETRGDRVAASLAINVANSRIGVLMPTRTRHASHIKDAVMIQLLHTPIDQCMTFVYQD